MVSTEFHFTIFRKAHIHPEPLSIRIVIQIHILRPGAEGTNYSDRIERIVLCQSGIVFIKSEMVESILLISIYIASSAFYQIQNICFCSILVSFFKLRILFHAPGTACELELIDFSAHSCIGIEVNDTAVEFFCSIIIKEIQILTVSPAVVRTYYIHQVCAAIPAFFTEGSKIQNGRTIKMDISIISGFKDKGAVSSKEFDMESIIGIRYS